MTQDVADTGVAAEELKQIIERAERVQEEVDNSKSDLKDIFQEAKSRGFDVKTLRTILRRRKLDRDELMEQEAILELYESALGTR